MRSMQALPRPLDIDFKAVDAVRREDILARHRRSLLAANVDPWLAVCAAPALAMNPPALSEDQLNRWLADLLEAIGHFNCASVAPSLPIAWAQLQRALPETSDAAWRVASVARPRGFVESPKRAKVVCVDPFLDGAEDQGCGDHGADDVLIAVAGDAELALGLLDPTPYRCALLGLPSDQGLAWLILGVDLAMPRAPLGPRELRGLCSLAAGCGEGLRGRAVDRFLLAETLRVGLEDALEVETVSPLAAVRLSRDYLLEAGTTPERFALRLLDYGVLAPVVDGDLHLAVPAWESLARVERLLAAVRALAREMRGSLGSPDEQPEAQPPIAAQG